MSIATTRRPSPAFVVSICALLIALGGTAYAAALPKNSVGTAQLKKNAVTTKKVDNKSLRAKDFKKGQLGAEVYLKNVGPGSVTVTTVVGSGVPDTVIQSLSLPAGTFYVRAGVYGINQNGALLGEIRCFLQSTGNVRATGTPGLYALMQPNGGNNINRATFTLDAAYKLKNPGTVTVECNKGAMAQTVVAGASVSAVVARKVTSAP
jgi:hypothetical protein